MSSAFSIALSSLQAESQAIDTTGNNLANLNTLGFKSSSVDFRDMVSESMGVAQGSDTGMGVASPINSQQFSQGGITSSSSPLAAAIQGNGFFVLKAANNQELFTRDGDFTVNSNGLLQTQTGENVQGWVATSSGLNTTGAPGDMVLQSGALLPPQATQSMTLNMNLNAAGSASTSTDTFSQPIQVYDSLGNSHTLTATFTKSASTSNMWNYDITIDGGDVTGGTAGTQQSILSSPGTLTFNSDGSLNTSSITSPVAVSVSNLADGASNLSINWNLEDSTGAGTITQYSETSSLSTKNVDGSAASQLSQISIGTGGQVIATFSNGQQKVQGQIALASIQNPQSLQNAGNNNFSTTGLTAAPTIGMPQTGGRGQILGGSLESSNVDMASEFTNLIVYQRGYQASSRVITTADQMSQDLLNLIH